MTNDFRQSTIPLKVPIVLAPLMESVLRWSLMLSSGSPLIFIQRPIVTVLLALVTTFPVLSFFRRRKAEVKEEDLDGDI